MMGSGKSTVGKIMSEVLGYSFFDRFVFCEVLAIFEGFLQMLMLMQR